MLMGLGLWGVTAVWGNLSAHSLLFPLKPEETFLYYLGILFSPSCFPSVTKMGKVSLIMGTVSIHRS